MNYLLPQTRELISIILKRIQFFIFLNLTACLLTQCLICKYTTTPSTQLQSRGYLSDQYLQFHTTEHSLFLQILLSPIRTPSGSRPDTVSAYSNQEITFVLDALSFGPRTVQYHYRILGVDTNYKLTTDQNLQFSNLKYGDYQLEAFATNSDGVRSNTMLISIIIKPYFYQTSIFKSVIILIFALTFFPLDQLHATKI